MIYVIESLRTRKADDSETCAVSCSRNAVRKNDCEQYLENNKKAKRAVVPLRQEIMVGEISVLIIFQHVSVLIK